MEGDGVFYSPRKRFGFTLISYPMTTLNLFTNAKDTENFKADALIFKEGDQADCMFAVVEGEVDIVLNGAVIDSLSSGMVLGEMGLIDGTPRSATARARTAVKLVRIDERRFNFLVQQTPFFALQMMRIISGRLRKRMSDPS